MAPEDVQKTAIVTPFGLFEYLFMLFRLSNAAQSFQRLMDRLFGRLPFVFTYLDDHLISRRTLDEHKEHCGSSSSCWTKTGWSLTRQNVFSRSKV